MFQNGELQGQQAYLYPAKSQQGSQTVEALARFGKGGVF
jgi:hypothetical protein